MRACITHDISNPFVSIRALLRSGARNEQVSGEGEIEGDYSSFKKKLKSTSSDHSQLGVETLYKDSILFNSEINLESTTFATQIIQGC